MENTKKTFLFDFNGTKIDDNDLWYASMSEVFRVHGKIPPTVEEYFYEMEGDWHKVYTSRGINATADQLNETYIPYYKKYMHEPRLFPDVLSTLAELYMRDCNIGLITGQPEELVTPILKRFHMEHYFDPRFSSMHDRNKKKTIQNILDTYGIAKENCFYVGDSPSDIKHGNHCGIQTVAFLTGFIPERLILDKKPKHYICNMKELLSITK